MQERTVGIGHNQPPVPCLIRGQPWPADAQAVISCRRQPVTTAGRARTGQWALRFERRTPPEIEPLMGWTGGDDTLTQVELTFDTREQAVAYAERQNLAYRVESEGATPVRTRTLSQEASQEAAEREAVADAMGKVVWLSWLQGRYGRCDAPDLPELDRAFVNPAAVFSSPEEVVRHPLLTIDCKREILWRWAWDEYLIEVAQAEGMPEGEPSRLEDVKAALRVLDREWSPDPAAPAAFIVHYRREGPALAA